MSDSEQAAVAFVPLYVLWLVLAYVVFVDSKRRWPWAGWWTRLVYVLTFGTPPRPGVHAGDGNTTGEGQK